MALAAPDLPAWVRATAAESWNRRMNRVRRQLVTELVRERQLESRAAHAMRRKILGAIVAVIALSGVSVWLIAFSQDDAQQEGARQPAPTAVQDARSEAERQARTERGNIPKDLGEIAGFGPAKAPSQNKFRIDRVVVDPRCRPGGTRPESQHTVLLQVTVETGGDKERAAMLGRILKPGFFSAIGRDGESHDAWPGTCTDASKYLPEEFGTNQTVSGTVELRLPVTSGILVLSGVMENAAGWEWQF